MNELFDGVQYVGTHIDGLLIISNGSFEDYINKLDNLLNKIKQKGFEVNAEKFFSSEMN